MNLIFHDFTKVNVAFFLHVFEETLLQNVFSSNGLKLICNYILFCSLPVLHAYLTNINLPVFFKRLAEWKVTKTSREGRDTTNEIG